MAAMRMLLTSRDVAAMLGITTRTVRLWAELEEIPALRMGRQWLFRLTEIRSWLAYKNVKTARRMVFASKVSKNDQPATTLNPLNQKVSSEGAPK
jgi:excisionase family DNA binding protein